MSNLKISNLTTTGSELFLDSESFLDELTNQEIDNLLGGDSVSYVKTTFIPIFRTIYTPVIL